MLGDRLHYILSVHGFPVEKYTVRMVSEMINSGIQLSTEMIWEQITICCPPLKDNVTQRVYSYFKIELFQVNLLCQYVLLETVRKSKLWQPHSTSHKQFNNLDVGPLNILVWEHLYIYIYQTIFTKLIISWLNISYNNNTCYWTGANMSDRV